MTRRRAVITGIGPITSVGIGRENFWRGIRAEKSGIRTISSFDTSEFNAHCAGEIPEWIPEDYFRILLNYSHASIEGGPLAAQIESDSTKPIDERKYGNDTVQMRFQIDF